MTQNLRFNHSAGKESPIELSRLSALRARASDISKPTRLDFHVLLFVIQGRGKHWLDFEEVTFRSGDIIHIRPSQVHAFDSQSRHEAFLLMFLPEVVQDSSSIELLNLYLTGVLRPKAADFNLLLELLKQHESHQSSRGTINLNRLGIHVLGTVVSALCDLLVPWEKREGISRAGSIGLVHTFERLLEKHYTGHRDLGWYVSQLNVTSRTLARACHAARGTSPKRLIDARIALEAKRKLIVSQDTVEELAFSLGFSESTNFVKFFKRIVGRTPEEFRRAPAAGNSSSV